MSRRFTPAEIRSGLRQVLEYADAEARRRGSVLVHRRVPLPVEMEVLRAGEAIAYIDELETEVERLNAKIAEIRDDSRKSEFADPVFLSCAKDLVTACWVAVRKGKLDARSPIGDAALSMRDLIDPGWNPTEGDAAQLRLSREVTQMIDEWAHAAYGIDADGHPLDDDGRRV